MVARTTLRSCGERARAPRRGSPRRATTGRRTAAARAGPAGRPRRSTARERGGLLAREQQLAREGRAVQLAAGQDVGHGGDCIETRPRPAWYPAAEKHRARRPHVRRTPRFLRGDRPPGRGWHGRGLPRPDTRLGRTVAIKVLRSGARPRAAAPARSRGARRARPQPSEHRPHLRRGTGGRPRGRALRGRWSSSRARRCAAGSRSGPLAISEMLDLGAQLADGLAKAHRRASSIAT